MIATVERPGGTDRFGNPLPPAVHQIVVNDATPRGSEERTDGQATVITGYSLYCPADVDVEAQDSVVLNADPQPEDERWRVEGEPARWSWMSGLPAGVVVLVTRTEG